MLPRQITILSQMYNIEEVDYISRDSFIQGEIDFENNIIKILKNLPEEKKKVVLLHEMIHAILTQCAFHEENNNEILISVLSESLSKFISY